jgi:hypothetical protein
MSRLQIAIEQIVFARNYTHRLLEHVNPDDWFRPSPGGVSHIAWQVGHLAFAQYRLALERIRGARSEDAGLISDDFLRLFGKGSIPDADPDKYPPPAAIRTVFDRVHRQVLQEIPRLDEGEWDKPVLRSHALLRTKIEALFWCSQHEAVHAGQIALLRRLVGHAPVW